MYTTLFIDPQTLSDLAIFGRSGTDSIFTRFNKTSSHGGSQLLEALFRQPLADAQAINDRAATHRFFSEHAAITFPIDSETLGTLAYYLSNEDVRSQLHGGAESFTDKLKGLAAADAEEKFVIAGVDACLRLFGALGVFIDVHGGILSASPFAESYDRLAQLYKANAFETIRQHSPAGSTRKLGKAAVADLDKQVRFEHREMLLDLIDTLYQLDVAITVGRVARESGFSFAVAQSGGGTLRYRQVYHPLVPNAIANDVALGAGEHVLFLTGANMAGKSTLMKSMGVALYLAHMGFPVPAEQLEFPVFDRIYTSINLSDNLSAGASHFYAEVLRVKEVAVALDAGKKLFVIFDELFRGTNVKDAHEGTVAIATAFAGRTDSRFILSTHIMEAGEQLQAEQEQTGITLPIQYQYLPTEVVQGVPTYPRVIKPGITADRQGMVIIENEGILAMLDSGSRHASAPTTFATDKQTLADLNLLGKYKTGSLFNLFNRVKTRGGELLLEDLFRFPLTAADAIRERSAIFSAFTDIQLEFPVKNSDAEQASAYLNEGRPSTVVSSYLSCYKERMMEIIYRSDAHAIQQRQIRAVQEVLTAAGMILGQLRKQQAANENLAIAQIISALEGILFLPGLKQLKAKYPYTLQQTVHCQFLFRNRYREQLGQLLQLLYTLDVYSSVGAVARDYGLRYAEPSHQDSTTLIYAENLRHPTLSGAVGNNVQLTTDSNLVFLTGANMAGKSTWMKTLGVSHYLAHMGFPVAADAFSFTPMEGIYTSINVPDDISQGWSHFYAEVKRVKDVAEQVSSGKRLFVLFDELFKGTNVKDAYDATLAVTERLVDYRHCALVISTHIIEVGDALKDKQGIQFRYMPTVMEGTVPRYPYRLAEGITEDRQGMLIIENEGIVELINGKQQNNITCQ